MALKATFSPLANGSLLFLLLGQNVTQSLGPLILALRRQGVEDLCEREAHPKPKDQGYIEKPYRRQRALPLRRLSRPVLRVNVRQWRRRPSSRGCSKNHDPAARSRRQLPPGERARARARAPARHWLGKPRHY